MWQIEAANKMMLFLHEHIEPASIELTGSILDPASLDRFSDVDMTIHLASDTALGMTVFDHSPFGKVFGYEIQGDTLRICFEKGQAFDLTFTNAHFEAINEPERVTNAFWFIASMVLRKLGRGDHLIAAHLALELCQMVIVMQMLERDDAKGTNIHRFGDRESVPILELMPQGDILAMALHAGEHMENLEMKGKLNTLRKNVSALG